MSMRKNKDEVFARHVEFMTNDKPTGTLIRFERMPWLTLPATKPLEDYNFPDECEAYMDALIEQERAFWAARGDFADDLLPVIKAFFGMAEHSCFVGGEVQYGGGTSYHHPPINDIEDWHTLACHEDNPNYQLLLRGMKYLQKRSTEEGEFFTSLRGLSLPMEMANAFRGNDFFMDIYDDEENVHNLLDFAVEAGLWNIRHQLEIVTPICGGRFTGFGVWMPGNAIGQVSEDASSLCSAAVYKEFGLPYSARTLSHFDAAQVHVHSLGRHVLPLILQHKNLRIVQIEDDPKQPQPIEVYREHEALLKDRIVMMRCTLADIENNIDLIARNKNIINPFVQSQAEADRALAILRAHTSV